MTTLYVAGVAMTKFGPIPGSSVRSLTAEAVAACLDDAGATAADVEAAFFANTMQGVLEGQLSIAGQIALRHAVIEGVPVVNVENACASGSTALWLACQHLQSGAADIVLAVGAALAIKFSAVYLVLLVVFTVAWVAARTRRWQPLAELVGTGVIALAVLVRVMMPATVLSSLRTMT